MHAITRFDPQKDKPLPSKLKPVSYLYSDQTKSEVDFYFDGCGFELKSNGKPTQNQKTILALCPQSFVIKKSQLPLMAYLVGEKRTPKVLG